MNTSFTEKENKYSSQVLARPNVTTMKKALVYTSIGDKLEDALEQLKNNEKAMINKESVFIIGSVPEPRDGQSCVLFEGNKLVVFGGDRNKFPFNDMFVYDFNREAQQKENVDDNTTDKESRNKIIVTDDKKSQISSKSNKSKGSKIHKKNK